MKTNTRKLGPPKGYTGYKGSKYPKVYNVMVSPKTHYWRGESSTLHITMEDLFGKDWYGSGYGNGWFDSAFHYKDTKSIRVTNRDTGNVVEFVYYVSSDAYRTAQNRICRVIMYKGTVYRDIAGLMDTEEVWLSVWERAEDLADYRRYVTDIQVVKAN